MSTGLASLSNPLYFPSFSDLPLMDEMDQSYYLETAQGMLQPARTWCFVGEIVRDSLSHVQVLGHRVEVRDPTGAVHSIMFYPNSGRLDIQQLKVGHTVFIRYATRCFFSDLATEAIKIEDLNFVKIIQLDLDSLMYVSRMFFEQGNCCNCHSDLSTLGGGALRCDCCGTARYCSQECKSTNAEQHRAYCLYCSELQEVYNIDFERFIQYVPFRV